jgi:hypothetical protein
MELAGATSDNQWQMVGDETAKQANLLWWVATSCRDLNW